MGTNAAVMLSLLMLPACTDQPVMRQTSSGFPEGVFPNAEVSAVRARIMDGCSSRGLLVQDANDSQVVCAKTMDGLEGTLAQMAVGNAYSTTPERKIRFVLFPKDSGTRVTAQQWIETIMPFGQVRRQDLNGAKQRNDVQQFLLSLGAQ